MNAIDLARQVKELRDAQKQYFATKNYKLLGHAKKLERQLDETVENILTWAQEHKDKVQEALVKDLQKDLQKQSEQKENEQQEPKKQHKKWSIGGLFGF